MSSPTNEAAAQNERTTLSWDRTGLGLVVCSLIAARDWTGGAVFAVGVLTTAAGVAVVFAFVTWRRYTAAVWTSSPAFLGRARGRIAAMTGSTVVLGGIIAVEAFCNVA